MPATVAFMLGTLVMTLHGQRKDFWFLKTHNLPREFPGRERLARFCCGQEGCKLCREPPASRAPAPWMLPSAFLHLALLSAQGRQKNPYPTGVQMQKKGASLPLLLLRPGRVCLAGSAVSDGQTPLPRRPARVPSCHPDCLKMGAWEELKVSDDLWEALLATTVQNLLRAKGSQRIPRRE